MAGKSGLVQLPEGAFVCKGHNMDAFFHIKRTAEEEIHSLLFYGDVTLAFVCF